MYRSGHGALRQGRVGRCLLSGKHTQESTEREGKSRAFEEGATSQLTNDLIFLYKNMASSSSTESESEVSMIKF